MAEELLTFIANSEPGMGVLGRFCTLQKDTADPPRHHHLENDRIPTRGLSKNYGTRGHVMYQYIPAATVF